HSQASGFLWRDAAGVLLVTNWHVLTGLHGFTGASLRQGWVPEQINVRYWSRKTMTDVRGELEQQNVDVSLFEHFDQPHWTQHQDFTKARVDIACIRMPFADSDASAVYCLNDYKFEPLFHMIGAEL